MYIYNTEVKFVANFVTPKFYSRELEDLQRIDVDDTIKRLTNEEEKIPKELYRWPLLTSHT